jgi:hypothetical protein
LKPLVGLNDIPFSAVFTADSEPVKTIVASAVPSPVVNDRPAIVLRVSVPFVAVSVILIGFAPRSTSATEIWLLLPLENTFGVSWETLCGPGTVFTGASFTAVMAIPRVLLPVSVPSFAVKVIVRDAVGF